MKILFYITILLFTLGQLGRVSFFNQTINGYLYEIPALFTFFYLFWQLKLAPVKNGWKDFKIGFLFLAALLVSYFLNFFSFSLFQNLVALLYLTRLIFYLGFFLYWGYYLKKQPEFQHHITNGLFILSALIVITSFIQYFLYPDLRNLLYLGWDPHLSRMFGVFFDTSAAAAIYGLFFLFFIKSYNHYKNQKYYKILSLIFTFFFLVAIVLTFSRSAYIVLMMVAGWHFFSQKKFTLIFLFLTLFFIILSLAPKPFGEGVNLKRTFSVEARLTDYKQAIDIWKKSPLLGVGYNRLRFVKPTSVESHAAGSFSSSFLIILVTGGILGFLGFIGSLRKLWLINKKTRIFLLFLGLLSFTDNIILHPFIMFLLGMLMVDK